MMRIENPARFVREMKGAPLSVVVLLSMVGGPGMSNGAIAGGTGYSDKTVSQALEYLEQIGMVTRAGAGWRMAEGVQLALPLGDPEIEAPKAATVEEDVIEVETEAVSNSDNNGGSRKFSDSEGVVNIVNSNRFNKKELTINQLDFNEEQAEKFRDTLAAMRMVGIAETGKTRELAAREYVDALYVLSHAEAVKRAGQRIGLAIWRMQEGQDRPLRRRSNGHLEGCKCHACCYGEDLELMDAEEEWDWWGGKKNQHSCDNGNYRG